MSDSPELPESIISRLSGLLKRMERAGDVPSSSNHPSNTPAVAAPVTTTIDVSLSRSEALKRFVSQPIIPISNSCYDSCALLTCNIDMKEDWKDDEWSNLVCVRLRHYTDDELVQMGKYVYTELRKGVSLKTVAQLMELAFNTKDAFDLNVFTMDIDHLIDAAKSKCSDELETTLTTRISTTKSLVLLNQGEADAVMTSRHARSFCFVSGCFLRLFSKSASNVQNIKVAIEGRFKNFYRYPLSIDNYFPEAEITAGIKEIFEIHSILRHTLYVMLYSANSVTVGFNIKNFMYDLHLTGLHSFLLFNKAMEIFKVNHRELATVLYSKKIESKLDAIMKIIANMHFRAKEQYGRGMWKYARLFDHTFFSTLQTKNCIFFTLIVANLVKGKTVDHANVMNISQLSGASESDKLMAEAYALRAMDILDDRKNKRNKDALEGQ